MAGRQMYKCSECEAEYWDVSTRADCGRCDCGGMGTLTDSITAGTYLPDERYKDINDLPPGEAAAVRRVQKQYEAMSEDILSGDVTIVERGPLALRPQCPEHLRKRYY